MDILRHLAIGALVLVLVVVPLLLWLQSLGMPAGLFIAVAIVVQSAAVAGALFLSARQRCNDSDRQPRSGY